MSQPKWRVACGIQQADMDLLKRKGYKCGLNGAGELVVEDPVWGYQGGRPYGLIGYQSVVLKDLPALNNFLRARDAV